MELLRALICFVQFQLFQKLSVGISHENEMAINVEASHLHRYVMCLVNMLNQQQNRTKLIIPLEIKLLSKLHLGRNWRPYNTFLLTSSLVQFRPKFLSRDWIDCSIDYFSEEARCETSFRIPIGVHPHFWTWIHPNVQNRNSGAFFAGDTSEEYDEFDESKWGIPSRNAALDFLIKSGFEELISSKTSAEQYLKNLQEHTFFIALSGVSMPLCHSLYEAIYFQCIPLVHTNMLELLDPSLSRLLRPYAWSSLTELASFLRNSRDMQEHDLHSTRSDLKDYWNKNFDPIELTKRIRQAKKVFICAEEKSVDLLNSNKIS